MTAPETTVLNTAEMQAALRLAGLPPGPASPFAHLSPPASIAPETASALFQKHVVNGSGAITDPWRKALTALTVPSHKASLFLGAPEQWFAIDYYAAGEAMSGCTASEPGYKITMPVSRENLEAIVSDWLSLPAAGSKPSAPIDLDADEMTMFAAIVDASREESLRALLERRMPDSSRFTRDQLAAEVEWSSVQDGRWLCSVLRRHSPSVFAPAGGGLGVGARKLAARGWLRLGDDDTHLEADLQSRCARLMNLNPYVALELRTTGGSASSVIVMTSLGSYWAIELFGGSDGRPMARLFELGGPEAVQLFGRYLAQLPAAPTWAPPASAPAPPQPAAAAWTPPPAAPAAAFPRTPPPSAPVAQSAFPVVPPAAVACPNCRKPLQPGRLFCTGCGIKVAG
jgi:hypothetical protein